MRIRWGLRGKSALALMAACGMALIPAILIGWLAVDAVRNQFSRAYAENYTLLQMQRILTPISRELALAERFAQSPATQAWMADENDPAKRERFMAEASNYQKGFSAHTYFAVVDHSGDYFFSSDAEPSDGRPRYRLTPDDTADSWYYQLVTSGHPYTLNVNVDRELKEAKVWINVVVRGDSQPLGIAGTGLDLTRFLDAFIRGHASGITPMIVNRDGALLADADTTRIAFNASASQRGPAQTQCLYSLLGSSDERHQLDGLIQRAIDHPGDVQMMAAHLDGNSRLLSIGYIPQLDWLLVTALDRQSAQLLAPHWIWPLAIGLIALLAALLAGFIYTSERLILGPIRRLQHSAKAIESGNYSPHMSLQRRDEIGDLSRAFADMAAQIERHTVHLETTVRQRTAALESANQEMAQAQRQIESSLTYASFIQRAILPTRELDDHLGSRQAVLWRPRDRVGGDIYVFHTDAKGYLLGIVDCAGHGVAGALMTMLVKASIDQAVLKFGPGDPAAILQEVDSQCRESLPQSQLPTTIATDIDMGLVWIEPAGQHLLFAGAKMALYVCDGGEPVSYPGGRRALGQKRRMRYANETLPLRSDTSYTLCSDGFLDQAGGKRGFGFGRERLVDMLQRHASLSPALQVEAFARTLDDYRGEYAQRDDITLLTFRFDSENSPL